MRIWVLNGPNLNRLGWREPEIYGSQTLGEIEQMVRDHARKLGFASVECRQTNHEGVLVEWAHEAYDAADAVILNAGAYTHTSLALHDALKMLTVPIVEVHLSDPATREPFRHFSFVAPCAAHIITGQGAKGYLQALDWLAAQGGA